MPRVPRRTFTGTPSQYIRKPVSPYRVRERKPIPDGFQGRPKDEQGSPGGRPVSPDQAEGFVYDQFPLYVNSSNVSHAQYFIESQQMLIGYLDGGVYMYDSVTEQEAIAFVRAFSKGEWVWSNIRVRGSKTAHRKPFRKIR